ncbi:hypothetical protein [Marinicellulosiphila megalodicopiae]|uniref:hypothetical protein n=1 Tax=Marinicellulosiphila megalodicopiae TaxID=2724896 RepID=UPI003BB04944
MTKPKNELAQRVLAHPHGNEQPFTRSKYGIQIPEEITKVIVYVKYAISMVLMVSLF